MNRYSLLKKVFRLKSSVLIAALSIRRVLLKKKGGNEALSCLFIYVAGELFVGLAFLNQFAFSAAYFNMNFRTALSLVTDEITH